MNQNIGIIILSEVAKEKALVLYSALGGKLYSTRELEGFEKIEDLQTETGQIMAEHDLVVFFSAMGICVRSIAPYLKDKHSDPAIICIDTTGKYVISVASGHIGGANEWTSRIASILGAEPIITTQSDRQGLWALDTLPRQFDWKLETVGATLNEAITKFVDGVPTAMFLDMRCDYLERTKPNYVDIYYHLEDLDISKYQLLIAVTPRELSDLSIPQILYRPQVLHLGIGCRHKANPKGVSEYILQQLHTAGFSALSIGSINSIELKRGEPIIEGLGEKLGIVPQYYSADQLEEIEVPNPSNKVNEVTSSPSVSEASALLASNGGELVIEKQKGKLSEGNDFTFALAIDANALPHGHIEIVGAGPGDPELISVRGKHFLQRADLILYAGSLVPIELTYYAKPGATVRSSADMNLEEQFALMKEFYDRNCLIVRLHTGDPCIYGAIQEQMALFDEAGMSYHITPGISSFLAAAAELRSQFTIPEKVQSIILTRGEGRTPMPEKEQLHKLAASQSTMCIYLSATLAEKVQSELLVHYPPETPVAVCHKLTWKEQKIIRGELQNLAQIIRDNKLTLTTLIVVGEAIDNRQGLSKLYNDTFKHLFRK